MSEGILTKLYKKENYADKVYQKHILLTVIKLNAYEKKINGP